jgi:hypothetical protein
MDLGSQVVERVLAVNGDDGSLSLSVNPAPQRTTKEGRDE